MNQCYNCGAFQPPWPTGYFCVTCGGRLNFDHDKGYHCTKCARPKTRVEEIK
jgi:DNA-directed RNA polymerase subunit RPC12/RpoP